MSAVRRGLAVLVCLPLLLATACGNLPDSLPGGGDEPDEVVLPLPPPQARDDGLNKPTPEEAGQTRAGARRFLEYWARASHRAATTGDIRSIRAISLRTCNSCAASVSWATGHRDAKTEIKSRKWRIRNVTKLRRTKADDEFKIRADLRTPPIRLKFKDNTVREFPGAVQTIAFELIWTKEGWSIMEWASIEGRALAPKGDDESEE
ncbi:DUF6318 family protein [Nocardioides sp.]|uniref:DUF6318 family protein n=1 Tax=Nocardioides sp. TaxID=35761 RepID=UPI0027349221|nr:DUF6318 family protein [Nocardioides sp.]MDP3894639.1 DUF6318 family protein [Nocardioides sp.]